MLQASSPLRTSSIIDKCITMFLKSKNKSFASFKKIEKKIYLKIKNKFVIQKNFFFQRDGSIFIFNSRYFLKSNKILSDISGGIILNKKFSIDIDTIEDFKKVKKILSR